MDGLTAVITGASRGIGRAVAADFADAGAQVIICGRNAETVEATVDALNEPYGADTHEVETDETDRPVSGLQADVGDEADCARLMEHAAERGGEIDIVIANAAVNHGAPGEMPTHEESYSTFDETMQTNVRGVFSTVVESVPFLAEEARILVPSGSVARKAKPGMGAYAISKAGAEAIARGFSADLDQPVCVVDPGLVATDLTGIEKARDPEAVAPMFRWVGTEADPEAIDGEIVDLRQWKKATR